MVAAAEDERFTHVKHGKRPIPFSTYELPYAAIDYCLREAGIELRDVAHVAYSFDPYLLLGRHAADATITLPLEPSAHPILAEWEAALPRVLVNAPRHLAGGAPLHLRARLSIRRCLRSAARSYADKRSVGERFRSALYGYLARHTSAPR